jgi:hypothetical protein
VGDVILRGRSVLIFFLIFFEGPCRQHHSDDLLSWLLHCGDTFSAAAVAIHSNNFLSVYSNFASSLHVSNNSRVCLPRASTFLDPYADRS